MTEVETALNTISAALGVTQGPTAETRAAIERNALLIEISTSNQAPSLSEAFLLREAAKQRFAAFTTEELADALSYYDREISRCHWVRRLVILGSLRRAVLDLAAVR